MEIFISNPSGNYFSVPGHWPRVIKPCLWLLQAFLILAIAATVFLTSQAAWYYHALANDVVVLYVDTDSAAGGDGTALLPFDHLKDALDSITDFPDPMTISYRIECAGTVADNTPCTATEFDQLTGTGFYIHIKGNNTSGKWDTTKFRLSVTNSSGIYNSLGGVVWVENMQVEIVNTDANAYDCYKISTNGNDDEPVNHKVINSIAKCRRAGGSGTIVGFMQAAPPGGTGTVFEFNNTAFDLNYGYNSDGTAFCTNVYRINCLAVRCGYGFVDLMTLRNCLAVSITNSAYVSVGTSEHYNNGGSDTSTPGPYARHSISPTFVNAASDDFRLSSSDTAARFYGNSTPYTGATYDSQALTRTGDFDLGPDQSDDGSIEQEGFRWRADDGSESAATWLDSQDVNITRATATNTRLRLLLNATGDPPTDQYQLSFKKSSDSTWKRVEVAGGGAITYGAIGTVNTTGTTFPVVEYPSGISYGDMLIMAIAHRPNASTITTPTGWTAPSNNTATGGAGAEGAGTGTIRVTVFYKIASMAEAGSEIIPIASGATVGAAIFRVSRTTGKDWSIAVVNGSDNTAGSSWSATMGSDPGVTSGDLVYVVSGSSEDTATLASQAVTQTGVTYGATSERTDTAVSTGNDLRLCITEHPISSGTSSAAPVYTMTASGTGNGNVAGASIFIRLRQSNSAIQLATSANIAASGADTTVQLTAPSGKSTSDFVAGRIQDDENPADTVNITTDDYTEMEWCIAASATAASSDVYQFRATIRGFLLDTYTVTPTWTIP